MQNTRNNKKGFTLVELLVVISIIALLLAILMPSLQKARGQAASVMCASNQKQVLTAMIVYATENNGFVPYFENPRYIDSKKMWLVPVEGWLGCLLPYVKTGEKLETVKFNGITWYSEKAFSKIGNCPAVKDPQASGKRPWSFGVNYPNVIDYSGKRGVDQGAPNNDYIAQFPWISRKLSQMPSNAMAFVDAGAWRWWVYNMSLYPLDSSDKDKDNISLFSSKLQAQGMPLSYNGVIFPHNKMANTALINGSVQRMSKRDICNNAGDIWGSKLDNPKRR